MSSTPPTISVVMPVFNAAPYIAAAVDSILGQTVDDFEFIIVNDGCTDNTMDILSQYTDKRLLVLENSTQCGISASLNKGIAAARGRYIARMDADDVSLPERFAHQVALLSAQPRVGYVATASRDMSAKGVLQPVPTLRHKTDLSIRWNLLWSSDTAHSSVMFRHSLFSEQGYRYRSGFDGAEDFDLWTRIVKSHHPTFIPTVLHIVRQHDERSSLTRKQAARHAHQHIMTRELQAFWGEPVSTLGTCTLTRLAIHPDPTIHYTPAELRAASTLVCSTYRRFTHIYKPEANDRPHLLFWTQKLLGRVLRAMVRERRYGLVVWHLRQVPTATRYGQLRKLLKYHVRPGSSW